MPMTRALPVCGASSRERAGFGAPVFDQRGGAGEARGSPASMASTVTFQQLARDDQALNFAGAFADGAELDVAIELLDRIIFDEAVAAVDLDGFVGDARRRIRRRTAWPWRIRW